MKTAKVYIAVLALGAVVLSLLWLGGCAKKLEGNAYENEKPIVWFVNVPPESARSSVNPIINWYGQDRDGQINYYRYIVIREDAIGDSLGKPSDWNPATEALTETEVQTFISQHLTNISDTLWTRLLVRADSVDPHTSNIVPMSAQIDNPVLTFVPQFVFVQAFDEEGLGSDIVFRRFLRNDNPPATRIVGFIDGVPFINSVFPTGTSTGIRIRWSGTDVIDYPSDPPPFEFEWKLFGPYTQEQYDYILNMHGGFLQQVFVTNDARVFKFGQPPQVITDTVWNEDHTVIVSITTRDFYTSLIVCDTTFVGGTEIEHCDTIKIDTLKSSNIYGNIDTLIRVYDEDFINSPYYVVADSSHDEFGNNWTTELRDSVYNVYANHPADTTQAGKFIFVVRSRDDAKVPDLTPAYKGFTVINPQHERDILVLDWSFSAAENVIQVKPSNAPPQRVFWDSAIANWIASGHGQAAYNYVTDYKNEGDYVETVATSKAEFVLRDILKYKVAIMLQDAAVSCTWSAQGASVASVMTALQSGVNVWVAMRVPIGSFAIMSGPRAVPASAAYQYFFGVQQYTFPGWGSFCSVRGGMPRTEDFVGALSLDKDQWPDLQIDTTSLRKRYKWVGFIPTPEEMAVDSNAGNPWIGYYAPLGAQPQVGWVVRSYDTECMYLFKSLYGNEHGIFRELSYHGRPVGIRLNRGLFRTVHFTFSPLALKTDAAREIVSSVLTWLYDGRNQTSMAKGSGESAAMAQDLGDRYWNAYWQANGDKDKFYELLKNAY